MICRENFAFKTSRTIPNRLFLPRRSSHLLLWFRLRLHLGLDHPDIRLRRPPHLRPRVRGDLLQGETGGGGRGGGDRRGVEDDSHNFLQSCQISMSPFQAPSISRRCCIPTSSWCRCTWSSWSSWPTWPWSSTSCPSTAPTSAHVQTPPPTLKMLWSWTFHPLSSLSCWLFLFKSINSWIVPRRVAQIYQSWVRPICFWKKAEMIPFKLKLCHLPTNLKRRPNCYTSPDEPLLFIISKLNVALLVFFVWMTRCPQLQFWRGVELKSMRLINIWLLSSSMLISEFCAQFLNFKEALNLTDLTWSLFLTTIQRTPFLKFRFLSTSYYL